MKTKSPLFFCCSVFCMAFSSVALCEEITNEEDHVYYSEGEIFIPSLEIEGLSFSVILSETSDPDFAPKFFISRMADINQDNEEYPGESVYDLNSGQLSILGLISGDNHYDVTFTANEEDDTLVLTRLVESGLISWLYMATAPTVSYFDSGTYGGQSVGNHFVISSENATMLQFSDRPYRLARDVAGGLEGFAATFAGSEFTVDPPNMTFAGTHSDTQAFVTTVMVVDNVFIDDGKVIFNASKALDGYENPPVGEYKNGSFIFDDAALLEAEATDISSVPTGSGVSSKLRQAISSYAPYIRFHKDEQWFPTSVANFQKYVHIDDNHYVTNDALSSASDYSWNGAYGETISSSYQPPIYAFVATGKTGTCDGLYSDSGPFVDVYYFILSAYNRGKQLCTGPYSSLLGCSTDYTSMGNHVGDWEHVTIRFKGNDTSGYTPVAVFGSRHGGSGKLAWGSKKLKKTGNHPKLWEAKGSHGMYMSTGSTTYAYVYPNGGQPLKDVRNSGIAWPTWNNIVVVERRSDGSWQCDYNQENCGEWLNYPTSFRWGNPKDSVSNNPSIFGYYRLEAGPTGPTGKSFVTNNNSSCY